MFAPLKQQPGVDPMADPHDVRSNEERQRDRNEDPITKEPGAHPVGVGAGAALGGAAAGAAAGAVAGPVGAVVGAVVGGVVGGLGGKAVAEAVDPTYEPEYWEKNYPTSSYYDKTLQYETLEPAYRYGWETRNQYPGRRFEDVEVELRRDWEAKHGNSSVTWERAKHAVRDAWCRFDSTCDTNVRPKV
jgi:phage tail tape-measure protein